MNGHSLGGNVASKVAAKLYGKTSKKKMLKESNVSLELEKAAKRMQSTLQF